MKKLFLLITALLTLGVSGAWAQDATVYTGINYYWRLYDTANSNARYIKTNAEKVGGSASMTDAGTFQLEDAEDGYYYIHEMTTDKYVYTTAAFIDGLTYTENGAIYASGGTDQVILTGTKENTDYFKWHFSDGTRGGCFFISSKANSNAVIAAQGQGSKYVNFYQKSGGYAFANSQFLRVSDTAELTAATATINSGSLYRIFTKNDGNSDGDTKYYLQTNGTLTNNEASAGLFTFTATTEAKYVTSGNAWFISANETSYFTNPEKATRDNNIHRSTKTTDTRRQDWDAQVLYKNEDGLFAIRATNAVPNDLTWHPSPYWIVKDNGNTLPDADYSIDFEDRSYVWQLEKPITYKLEWNGSPLASCTKTIYQSIGDAVFAASSADVFGTPPAFCSYGSASVSTIEKETTEVTYDLIWDGPFQVSDDYSTAIWYYVNLNGDDDKYLYSHGAESQFTKGGKDINDRSGHWAFFGNPYDNFYIMNRNDGSSQYVQCMTPSRMNTSLNATWGRWKLIQDGEGFKMRLPVQDYWFADNVNSWVCNSSGSGAATIYVEAVPLENIYNDIIAQLETFSYGQNIIGRYGLSGDFAGHESQAADLISGWKSQGYNEARLTLVQAMFNSTSLNTPSEGFYRLKNVATGKYLKATALSVDYNDANKYVFANGNATESATVIQLQPQIDGLYMFNQGYSFGWAVADKSVGAGVGYLTTNPDKYVNWFPGTEDGQLAFAICYGNGTGPWASYLEKGIYTANSDEEIIAGTDYTTDGAQWVVEDATDVTINLNTVGSKSYATFSAPFPVTIGDGAKAYTVELNGDRAVYTEIASKEIPAGAGVLLISDTKAASVTATISNSDFSALSNNDLDGFYLDQTFTYPEENNATWKLVLGNSATSGIGFYKMSGTATGNKAYLPYTYTTSDVKGFRLVASDEETGILSIDGLQSMKNAPIFNLAGQRVTRTQKGLYIQNGKKVLVK